MTQPMGTVTLLFTDLARSTALWEQHPVEMGVALAVHDGVIRDVVAVHGGRVFATGGDGFCVAFATPSDAMAAATDAQRRLAAEVWPTGVEMRVRMALHTGEVEERDGDYFGSPLNRVARLIGMAHGGQVVVSEVTAQLTRDRLPVGVDLVDVGRHRLKDLTRPEHVFQLSVNGLEAVFPPLRSLDATATNLPLPRTSFVGRAAELGELEALVRSSRLVTVTGAGGSGKTRLAVELARAILRDFDGVWFTDLSPIVDGERVVGTVAQALGLAVSDERPVLARLLEAVGDRRCLVVLDNCEQVLDAAGDVVEELLGSCSAVQVVVTSREALGVAGEQVWRVPALALDGGDAPSEAASLFVDRARLVDVRFVPTSGQRLLIESVCRRLDGLPLAIELAAARVAGLGVEEVARGVDDMFSVLVGGRRRAARQATLRASIAWSYDLLAPPERRLLPALSVFAGGFTLDAARGVCADEIVPAEDVAAAVAHLVDQSLVVADHLAAGTRYRLLDTIRAFAAEELAGAGREDEVRDRHLAWYARWSYAQATAPGNWSALQFSRSEVDNQRHAAQWAIHRQRPDALAELLVDAVHGFAAVELSEASHYLDVLRSYDTQLDAVDRDRLAFCQVALGMIAGQFRDVLRICEQQRSIAVDELMWPKFTFLLAFNTAWITPDRSLSLYDELEQRTGATPLVTYGRAVVALTNRRYADAVELILATLGVVDLDELDTSEAFTRPSGDSVAFALQALATALHLCDRNADADAALERAVSVGVELFKHYPTVLAAAIRASQGDHQAARELLAVSVATVRRTPNPLATADCAIGAAALAHWMGRHELASATLAAVKRVGAFRTEASVALYRGYADRVRSALGRPTPAFDTTTPIDEALDNALNALAFNVSRP